MANVLLLGAGRVGNAIARDLASQFRVTTADRSAENLKLLEGITETFRGDLSDPNLLAELIKGHDLVIGALPGDMGFATLDRLIPFGKPIVDISFFPEDPAPLDRKARQFGTSIVYDCGVAPGMGNIILAHHDQRMAVNTYQCFVGGLPLERTWPWEYKAVFSPYDVIEEYTRPARFRINGREVIREALSEPELIEFDGIGTLEAWNSDGLRSLLQTMRAPNMIEKTLRYPGTIQYLKALRNTGFFSKEPLIMDGMEIRPLDLSARLLMKHWQLMPGDKEFTVMRIEIEGVENGKAKKYEYSLLDRTDETTGTSSMARTTGFTCTAVVSLLVSGLRLEPGCHPPEEIGRHNGALEFVLRYQQERGISYGITNYDL